MPKEELVEGIKQAMARGESLEKAMMSFYTSGYKKEDVEQAAAAVVGMGIPQQPQQPVSQPIQQATPVPQKQEQSQPPQPSQQPMQQIIQQQQVPQPSQQPMQQIIQQQPPQPQMYVPVNQLGQPQFQQQPVQRVSSYGISSTRPKKTGVLITIILVVILLMLIGVLAAVVLFKDDLTTFFNGLFIKDFL
jgi:FtsZ-interacting cell division protein ZipA